MTLQRWILCALVALPLPTARGAEFRAGAAQVEVSPRSLPVIVNGGFLEQTSNAVRDALFARAIVLDDGKARLAIVVVDSCMMPRELIDRAKALAHKRTGIPEDRMLVSATHTHSAPACMGALGSRPDETYAARLPEWIAEAVANANARLAPAQVGWTIFDDSAHTHCRRWIRRPDRILTDPFGERTVRANMHPGYESPDVIGPAGPVDPAVSVVLFRTPEGQPIALLANYSMHYFGAAPVSAYYFGRFAARVARELGGAADRPCIAIMSQGTSGDQHWMDYGRPKDNITIDQYAEALADEVLRATRTIEFQSTPTLAMAETHLKLRRRTPDEKRLAWARGVVNAMGDRSPRNQPEVYAKEALYLHEEPERELKLQAIRIGELGLVAIPDEVYALSGLKIKAQSPLAPTFVIELANGSEGYIPTPEQHTLGGYTTWPARTAGLEVGAEPAIVEGALGLLEQVAGKPRRAVVEPGGPYMRAVVASKPIAYWRLSEMSGDKATDATGHGHAARLAGGFARYLEGPATTGFTDGKAINRSVHLAGGYLSCKGLELAHAWSAELWFWNGLPHDARPVTGILLSESAPGRRLVLGKDGRLVLAAGDAGTDDVHGKTVVPIRTWHHAVLVRDGERLAAYLDGRLEASCTAPPSDGRPTRTISVGGAPDAADSLEGRIDEVAVCDRALTAEEIAGHYAAAGTP